MVSASVCGAVRDSLSDVSILRNKRCYLCVCATLSGYVLRVGEGSVHGGLQHLFGLPHHGHGHPVQVQVRWDNMMNVSVISRVG